MIEQSYTGHEFFINPTLRYTVDKYNMQEVYAKIIPLDMVNFDIPSNEINSKHPFTLISAYYDSTENNYKVNSERNNILIRSIIDNGFKFVPINCYFNDNRFIQILFAIDTMGKDAYEFNKQISRIVKIFDIRFALVGSRINGDTHYKFIHYETDPKNEDRICNKFTLNTLLELNRKYLIGNYGIDEIPSIKLVTNTLNKFYDCVRMFKIEDTQKRSYLNNA